MSEELWELTFEPGVHESVTVLTSVDDFRTYTVHIHDGCVELQQKWPGNRYPDFLHICDVPGLIRRLEALLPYLPKKAP